MILPVLLGGLGGLAFIFLAHRSARSEERVIGWGLYIAALIYVAFAIAGGAALGWIGLEALGVVAYGVMAARGSKGAMAWLGAGWGLHVLWDVGLHGPDTAFVPGWYPLACVAFDFIVAGYAIGRTVNPDEVVEVVSVAEWREERD